MMTLAPTPAARVASMRDRFEAVMTAIGELQDQMSATPHPVTGAESDVLDTLARIERMAEQAAREHAQDRTGDAWNTSAALVATIQGELLVRLRALAACEADRHAAADVRNWLAAVEQFAGEEAA